MNKKFFLGLSLIIFMFMASTVFSLGPQDDSAVGIIRDPFEAIPEGTVPNCDQEHRFKYETTINSTDEFIAFLKTHQSNDELNVGFKPTQKFLLPGYTLGSVGSEKKTPINLDNIKAKVETIDLKDSKLSNKKIFILTVWFEDFGENYPWQIIIKASNNAHFLVKFCAGI